MWIARNSFGSLYLFVDVKPWREGTFWNNTDIFGNDMIKQIKIDPSLFPELAWTDEPIEVEIVKK